MFNDVIKKRMNSRLVNYINQLTKIQKDKRDTNSSFNNLIKDLRKKSELIATVIKTEDSTLLDDQDIFEKIEVEDLLNPNDVLYEPSE